MRNPTLTKLMLYIEGYAQETMRTYVHHGYCKIALAVYG
jgi:hypothetical protein